MGDELDGLFGRSRDHVVALDAGGAAVYRNAVARERPWTDGVEVAARRVLETGAPASVEWGDGVQWWYSAELSPREGGGVLCVSRDVTALRRSHLMLQDTQGVAHLGTWEWDVSQPTATWSPELYRIYGLTPETYTPSYEAYLAMVHPDDRQRVIDATNRVFHEHVPYSHDERIYRADGAIRYLHTWAFPLLDDAGTLTHLVGVCQDVTDRAEVEERASMLVHDLRGPLSVVQMAIEMIARDHNLSSSSAGYVDRGQRAVAAMSTLMRELLAIAKRAS